MADSTPTLVWASFQVVDYYDGVIEFTILQNDGMFSRLVYGACDRENLPDTDAPREYACWILPPITLEPSFWLSETTIRESV